METVETGVPNAISKTILLFYLFKLELKDDFSDFLCFKIINIYNYPKQNNIIQSKNKQTKQNRKLNYFLIFVYVNLGKEGKLLVVKSYNLKKNRQ